VSIQDINDQKTYYDSDFDITFETYTVVEKLKAEAEDDYVAQTIIDTMVDDDGELILRRGM
tara:strand:- start:25667 stop:25849 length:183 start_codon:yes stop_codon:yes gene_type:complete